MERDWGQQFFLLLVWTCGLLLCPFSKVLANDVQGLKKGVVKITAHVNGITKVGTGVLVRLEKDVAFIVTASHVIEGDPQPMVQFYAEPGHPVPAKVLGMEGGDPRGLAVLVVRQTLPNSLRVLPLDAHVPVEAGQSVTVIGFPRMAGAPWAVTVGELVGRKGRDLVFSGAVDEGNSGGPLFKDHQVVGIVTEASPPFAYAAPAVLVQYVLESWGIRFGVPLRSQPATLSLTYLRDMIEQKGLHHPYDGSAEGLPGGRLGTIRHEYSPQRIGEVQVVVDKATGLMWQRSGSSNQLTFGIEKREPWEYVEQLNQEQYGGFSDWRLPTIEELASLLEPIGQHDGLFIDPVFDKTQWVCVSADGLIRQAKEGMVFLVGPWELFVDYSQGRINHRRYVEGETRHGFVRAVRTMAPVQSSPIP